MTDFYLPHDRQKLTPVARRFWGGDKRGCVVEFYRVMKPGRVLVSEVGQELTVAELELQDGAGREVPE